MHVTAVVGISLLLVFAVARVLANRIIDVMENEGGNRLEAFRIARWSRIGLTALVLALFGVQLIVFDWAFFVNHPTQGLGLGIGAFPALVRRYALGWMLPVVDSMPLRALLIVLNIAVRFVALMAPYLVMMLLAWTPMHKVDRLLRNSTWSLRKFLSFHLRNDLLILLVPALLFWTIEDAITYWQPSPLITQGLFVPLLGTGVAMFAVYLVAPFLLTTVWVTRPMPESPLRRRLEALCRRAGIGFRNILIWDTMGGGMANACVTGFFKQVRYVLVTDTLLNTMDDDEVEAVFGHELGHARYHHFPFFFLFILSMMFFLMATGLIVQIAVDKFVPTRFLYELRGLGDTAELTSWVLALGLYFGVFFGIASRRFERQADLFGAFAVNRPDVFARALEKVAYLNGADPKTPAWRHFSIRKRCDFLFNAAENPKVVRGFEWELKLVMAVFALVTTLSMSAIVYAYLYRPDLLVKPT